MSAPLLQVQQGLAARRAVLARRVRLLVAATITYNVIEAVVAIARTAADPATAWRAAERAHILSQPWPWRHTVPHAVMLRRALRERDPVEAVGQVIRLAVAGPGSAIGRYPEGNTGRARVPLTQPMRIPDDLAHILSRKTA